MNHNEEMRMLGYLKKISESLERTASSLERLACYKQQESVSAQIEDVYHDCSDCAYANRLSVDEPCLSCYRCNKWEAKK